MAVGMQLLIRHLKILPGPVQMVNIHQPDPWDVPILGNPRISIPLRLFPKLVGLFQVAGGQGRIHITVHGLIGIRRILCQPRFLHRMVNVIELHRRMRAPAPHQGLCLRPVISRVPANALCLNLNPNFL